MLCTSLAASAYVMGSAPLAGQSSRAAVSMGLFDGVKNILALLEHACLAVRVVHREG